MNTSSLLFITNYYYRRTSVIRPCIIQIFNNPISNPLSQLHLSLLFYRATIDYHVELNANSGGHRHPVNVQEKWTQNTGKMPWNRGDPSSDAAIHFLF